MISHIVNPLCTADWTLDRMLTVLCLQVEVNDETLHYLSLAIKVLTSNTCSEEGLEDATALLLNMTVNLANTRENVSVRCSLP